MSTVDPTKWRSYMGKVWHFMAPHGRAQQNKQLRQAQDVARHHLLALSGEFFGSIFFFSSQFSGIAAAASSVAKREGVSLAEAADYYTNQDIIFIATSNGLAAMVLVWICFRISGAFFNPAISLASFLVGSCTLTRAIMLAIASTLGGLIAAAVVKVMLPGDFVAMVKLGNDTTPAQGVFIEMMATTLLVFTALYSFRQRTKATYLSPILIGICIFVNILGTATFSGGALNPIRAFAPAVIAHSFDGYHWIYWIGPMAGGFFGAVFYRSVNYLHKVMPSGNENADRSKEEQEAIDDARAKIVAAREKVDLERQEEEDAQANDAAQSEDRDESSSDTDSEETLHEDAHPSPTSRPNYKSRQSVASSKQSIQPSVTSSSKGKKVTKERSTQEEVEEVVKRELEADLAEDPEQKGKPSQAKIWAEDQEETEQDVVESRV